MFKKQTPCLQNTIRARLEKRCLKRRVNSGRRRRFPDETESRQRVCERLADVEEIVGNRVRHFLRTMCLPTVNHNGIGRRTVSFRRGSFDNNVLVTRTS